MKISSITDKGMVRKNNQDSFFAGEIENSISFAIVCDGMGGAAAGNIASENAVRHISEYVIKSYRTSMDEIDLEKTLRNAIVSANIELYGMAVNNPDYNGMGTTAVVAIIKDSKAIIANVGDSRIYLLNDGIRQLTRDHSVVQSLIESGRISPEDARVHPRKNVITRALGAEENVAPDSAILEFEAGDTLLLCTDGLTNYLDDGEILKTFTETEFSALPKTLADKANKNGGGDNITVVALTD